MTAKTILITMCKAIIQAGIQVKTQKKAVKILPVTPQAEVGTGKSAPALLTEKFVPGTRIVLTFWSPKEVTAYPVALWIAGAKIPSKVKKVRILIKTPIVAPLLPLIFSSPAKQ
jgi:hypothetical protein